jgi:hypothetical protein
MTRVSCLVAVLGLLASAQLHAQANGVYVDIAACLEIESESARHACYVARGDELRATLAEAARPAAPLAPATAEQHAPAPQAIAERTARTEAETIETFGREIPAAAERREATARILANDDGAEELIATIAELDEQRPNMWDVTLSNDQVWRQVNSEKYRLREGMQVRIYPSAFAGSFRLSANGVNGFIQVRRIR